MESEAANTLKKELADEKPEMPNLLEICYRTYQQSLREVGFTTGVERKVVFSIRDVPIYLEN